MGTQIHYTPIYGPGTDGPVCGILQVDKLLLLLDCGWDDQYNTELLESLKDVIGHVDGVLLSHPDPLHLGALPYLVGQLKLSAPVYATHPVHKMGQMFMYDQYLTRHATSDFEVFNLDDVDEAFSRITPLKYQQTLTLEGAGEGFSITPFVAGHMVGGSLWRITTPEEEHIVYAVHYNHKREAHLNAAVLDTAFLRPAVLITDAENALSLPENRASRDKEFQDAVVSNLRQGGNVLVPVDAAGRLLEIVLLLERYWDKAKLRFPLVLLSPVAFNVLEFAKSQLAWMSDSVGRSFEHTRNNPFSLKHMKLCYSRSELEQMPPGPKLVLATAPTLEAGGSRQLFAEWAGNPKDLIIFVGQAQSGTLAGAVQQQGSGGGAPFSVPMQLSKRVPLEGEELLAWQDSNRAQAIEEANGNDAAPPAELPTRLSSSSVGGVSRTYSGSAKHVLSSAPSRTLSLAGPLPYEDVLIDGFDVPKGAAGPMFPFENSGDELKYDDYGAFLQPGTFRQAEGLGPGEATEEDAEEDEEPEEEVPTKVVSEEVTVTVRAKLLRLDYDGRSDGRSMRMLLSHVAPRHLIIMHGSLQAMHALSEACAKDLQAINSSIHLPSAGKTVDVSPGSSSFQVVLADGLHSQLHMRPMGEYHVAWVHGVLGPIQTATLPELLPDKATAVEDSQGGIFIGDVKLSELKTALAEKGIASEFLEGQLVCSGSVTVKRTEEDAGVVLEGPLSEEYYRIRSVLYGQYHVC